MPVHPENAVLGISELETEPEDDLCERNCSSTTTFWTGVFVFDMRAIRLGGRLTKQFFKDAKTTSTFTDLDISG